MRMDIFTSQVLPATLFTASSSCSRTMHMANWPENLAYVDRLNDY